MCKSFKHTLIQRRYTNSQHTYEKIITTLDLQANVQHTIRRHDLMPLWILPLKKKRKENNQCGGTGALVRWDWKTVQSLRKTVWRFLKVFNIQLPYNPVIPLLGIDAKEFKQGLEEILACSQSKQQGSQQAGGGSHPSVPQWEDGWAECGVSTSLLVCTAVMKYPRLGIYKEQNLRLDVVNHACKSQHSGGGGERTMVLRLAWVTE